MACGRLPRRARSLWERLISSVRVLCLWRSLDLRPLWRLIFQQRR